MQYLPQYIYLAVTILGLGFSIQSHGQPKTGYKNVWIDLIDTITLLSLLWWGGFFNGMFK